MGERSPPASAMGAVAQRQVGTSAPEDGDHRRGHRSHVSTGHVAVPLRGSWSRRPSTSSGSGGSPSPSAPTRGASSTLRASPTRGSGRSRSTGAFSTPQKRRDGRRTARMPSTTSGRRSSASSETGRPRCRRCPRDSSPTPTIGAPASGNALTRCRTTRWSRTAGATPTAAENPRIDGTADVAGLTGAPLSPRRRVAPPRR